MTSTGGSRPVQIARLRAPWRTSTSRPSTRRAPRSSAQRANGVGPVSVDEVHHHPRVDERQAVERVLAAEADRGRVHEQLGVAGSARRPRPRARPQAAWPREAVRFQMATSAPAWRSAHAAARAGAAGAEHERRAPGPARRARRAGRAPSVLSPRIRPSGSSVSVFTAPMASAAARQLVGERRARRACAGSSRWPRGSRSRAVRAPSRAKAPAAPAAPRSASRARARANAAFIIAGERLCRTGKPRTPASVLNTSWATCPRAPRAPGCRRSRRPGTRRRSWRTCARRSCPP